MDVTSFYLLARGAPRPIANLLVSGIVVAIVLAVFGVIATSKWFVRRRRNQLRQLCEDQGWEFDALDSTAICSQLGAMPLFQIGRGQQARNVIRVATDETQAVLFDFQYITGSGKSQQTHSYTPVAFSDATLDLPQFSFTRRTWGHRIAGWFGYRSLELPRHPEFCETFYLKGNDASAIEEALPADLVAVLVDDPYWAIESSAPWLLVYRTRKPRVKVGEIEAYFRDALGIYLLLARSRVKAAR